MRRLRLVASTLVASLLVASLPGGEVTDNPDLPVE